MDANDIRKAFLAYFEGNGHTVVPSSPLIPRDDPTLFFVNAGMVPFKDAFTGAESRDYARAASVQKCMRVSGKHNDLENVGQTPRHHTFFEMLGNFSFGSQPARDDRSTPYFKDEALRMAWELLTERLKVDADRLWVTVLDEDEESFALWRDRIGVPEPRIQRLGPKDNFWAMGERGPCGPCSEIHYDHGPAISGETGGPATEDPRYIEIWNLVFMQYEQTDGGRVDLPRPSIDTGMGLERIAAVLQGVYSNYDTDLFQPLIRRAAELSGARYGDDPAADTALRVIADHSRAATFLVGDGVMPSNEGRGYVLRRIMRRAIRFGVKLGIDDPFLHRAALEVVEGFGDSYPELRSRAAFIEEVVRGEEERFRRTLDRGMHLLDEELAKAGDGGTLPGEVAFTLSDTYGFPLDLTQLIARERRMSVDEAGFDRAMEAQRARGRAAWKGSGEEAVATLWAGLSRQLEATRFTGYEQDEDVGTVLAVVRRTVDGDQVHYDEVERLEPGERGVVVLDKTPFYAESGGQVGDSGRLADAKVTDTTLASGLVLHHVVAEGAGLSVGDVVEAKVDAGRRDHTRRNHTATHLLHAALRQVLGEHVTQKGSLVAPDRLRFDFAHHKPMAGDEIRIVEDIVNRQILENKQLDSSVEELEAAVARGAMALFGEKYADAVRVVSVPGFSVELCGGTHCHATGDIGLFKIVSEGGIAAGVRRIEAQTGVGALQIVQRDASLLSEAAGQLRTSPEQVVDAITRLQEERRGLERELQRLKVEAARLAADSLVDQAQEVGGVKVLAAAFDGDLREQADRLRDQLGSSVVVLAGRKGDKVQLLVATTKDLAGRFHAGKAVQELAPLVGGRGGGRPDLAQAGGTNPEGIEQALQRARAYVAEQLGG